MEHDSIDLNDPIAQKLRDSETVERLVRQAVAEAVAKARKLGFLDEKNMPVTQAKPAESV
jgi:DNA-binding protein YbaB